MPPSSAAPSVVRSGACPLSRLRTLAHLGHASGRRALAILLLAASGLAGANPAAPAAPAPPLDRAERKAILDAIRPMAAQRTRQVVKIKVERLNVDQGWALLTGELVSASGGPLIWERAPGCYPELDKLLWVVLAKTKGRWTVRHLDVCATEPPHWTLAEHHGGFAWPCGVYAGLLGSEGQDLEQGCRQARAATQRP